MIVLPDQADLWLCRTIAGIDYGNIENIAVNQGLPNKAPNYKKTNTVMIGSSHKRRGFDQTIRHPKFQAFLQMLRCLARADILNIAVENGLPYKVTLSETEVDQDTWVA